MTVCGIKVPESHLENIAGYSSVVTLKELESSCEASSEILNELLKEVKTYSLRYLATVCEYFDAEMTMTDEDRKEGLFESIDRRRSLTHNATIGAFNALARRLKAEKRNSAWIQKISGNRAAYGKLALTIALAILEGRGEEENEGK